MATYDSTISFQSMNLLSIVKIGRKAYIERIDGSTHVSPPTVEFSLIQFRASKAAIIIFGLSSTESCIHEFTRLDILFSAVDKTNP